MALLGIHVVITLVMVSVIQKLGPHYSLARWFLCSTGLFRYLYPTNSELRALAGVPKDVNKQKGKKGKHYENGKTSETFHIPRNLDITLETTQVTSLDVIHLRYYTEYQWLFDFSLYAATVYLITEVVEFFYPLKDEMNLSMVWCFLVIIFAIKILMSLTLEYFKSEESVGERSTVIVTTFAYLLVAMMVLIIDEEKLELGLNQAYASFNSSAATFLEAQGLDSKGPASKIVLKFFLAVWAAIVGALFTFPGLRMARMHWDCLRYCSDNRFLKCFLYLNFMSSLVTVLMWVKPIARDYLTVRIFSGMTEPLMKPYAFESLRLFFIVFCVILHVCLMPVYLQAYLNMAHRRLEDQKKEAGRITNLELQKKIAAVFIYLCVVTLQYLAPLLLCLFFSLMFKTMGGYTWTGLFGSIPSLKDTLTSSGSFNSQLTRDDDMSIQQSAAQFTLALDSLKQVFSKDVLRGLFGFATWWSCFAWFSASSLGLLYQSYFAHT